MENVIARLVQDFEDGKVSRRQLIQGLAVVAGVAASTAKTSASSFAKGGFQTIGLDHISYQVSDYRRSRDFYADLMGMTVANDNGSNQCQLAFGDSLLIARNHRDASATKPVVDHVSFKIADWDTERVEAELVRRGLTPRLDTGGGEGYASFHVADPDGYDLQISGDVREGDKLYKNG